MRAVVQRVRSASVQVDGKAVGVIGPGLLVYLGAGREETARDISWTVNKLATLRIFSDADGRMSRSVEEAGGQILVVSQFTLFGDVRKGRRPSFDAAAPPEEARGHYASVCEGLRQRGILVETGRFQASMLVRSEGDGPVTILVDSRKNL